MPIGLGIGLTISQRGGLASGFSLTAPVLSIESGVSVAIPVLKLIVDDDIPAGYKFQIAASVNADMSSPFETTLNEITGDDLTDGQIDSDTPGYDEFAAMTDGAKYFRAVILNASDAQASGYSNIPTITLEVASVITSAATANCAENATLSHALTANESVTWSIVGGADQARFEISGSTLRWASNGTKDYETPNDADTNNTYVVTVRATDSGANTTDQTITITVTDVSESVAPVVAASNNSVSATATSLTTLLPASISAGDMLLVVITVYNAGTPPASITEPATWSTLGELDNAGTRTKAFWKIASGSEGANVVISHSSGRPGAIAYRITGHHASAAPEIQMVATADPPSLTPTWGSAPNLWIAAIGGDANTNTTNPTAPATYTDNAVTSNGANGDSGKSSAVTKAATATSDDPATFTGAGTPGSPVSMTIAVRPL